MEVWISNEQEQVSVTPRQEEIIRLVAEMSLKRAGAELGEHVSVSVTLVDDAEIQALNREHRGLDKPTDVLSFSQLEGEELGALPEGEPLPLGDIVISMERCVEQAEEYGHSVDREVGFLVCHGMLHLLGFDHADAEEEAAMTAATEAILAELGLTRP